MPFSHFKCLQRVMTNLVVSMLCLSFSIISLANQPTSANENPTIKIIIPGPLHGRTVRNEFVEELLHIIFEKQQLTLDLQYLDRSFSQGRALKILGNGDFFDLNWSVTSIEREQELLPIRIPIYRGLIGWRVFLIRPEDQKLFSTIKSVKDLEQYVGVQSYDWPDYDVLLANNLTVEGNLTFPQMSRAVKDGIGDYFPRSVLEVQSELDDEGNKHLVLEKSLVLKYPSAFYFFVNKANTTLADTVRSGFEKALNDGSYLALFNRHHGLAMKEVNLKSRRVIELKNPMFPFDNIAEGAKYWYQK